MHTTEKHPLPRKIFDNLMVARELYCVSIYLPMNKGGKEQNQHLAQARLKKCIREVKAALVKHQIHNDEIEDYLKPIEQLLAEIELWRNPSDGLSLFLDSKKGLRYYKIPIEFGETTYVANHFYLLPLLPLYEDDGSYYLLELSQDYVKLFEASRYHFKDMQLEVIAPSRLEDAVGYDYEEKSLGLRSGPDQQNAGFYYGHGEGKDDRKIELTAFFKEIDKGVRKVVTDRKAPIVLFCSNGFYGLYAKVNSHQNLFKDYLSGDPEFQNNAERHQASWSLVAPYFKERKMEKITRFKEAYHTQKTSYEMKVIMGAALSGRIETLFVAENADVFGIYDQDDQEVIEEPQHTLQNTSLINLAALQTYGQGGNVYFLPKDEMPVKESLMNAIFRF